MALDLIGGRSGAMTPCMSLTLWMLYYSVLVFIATTTTSKLLTTLAQLGSQSTTSTTLDGQQPSRRPGRTVQYYEGMTLIMTLKSPPNCLSLLVWRTPPTTVSCRKTPQTFRELVHPYQSHQREARRLRQPLFRLQDQSFCSWVDDT